MPSQHLQFSRARVRWLRRQVRRACLRQCPAQGKRRSSAGNRYEGYRRRGSWSGHGSCPLFQTSEWFPTPSQDRNLVFVAMTPLGAPCPCPPAAQALAMIGGRWCKRLRDNHSTVRGARTSRVGEFRSMSISSQFLLCFRWPESAACCHGRRDPAMRPCRRLNRFELDSRVTLP